MAISAIRTRDKDSLAQFLGWFSLALGTAQVTAPRTMARLVGASGSGAAPVVMRLLGVRELVQGTGILARPRPARWLWSRVAGDGLDLGLLLLVGLRNRRGRTVLALANVAAVTVPDIFESRQLSRQTGPPRAGMRIRKAVTINRPRQEVQEMWTAATEVRQKVDKAGASVSFLDAPGNRGTELAVEFTHAPLGGDLGAAVRKLTGHDLATQLADDLRLVKQQVETGETVRSDAVEAHRLVSQIRQRRAQPLAGRAA